MKKVFIVGLGNLGKRHLQSVSELSTECSIFCFDKNKEVMDSVPVFCKENSIHAEKINLIYDIRKIYELIDIESIVIVATTANNRENLLTDLINKKPLAIIAEKPLTQNLSSYKEVMALGAKKNVAIYINYIAHMQPVYQQIYKELENVKEFAIYTNMPNWGIACVGIHQFELLTWLFNVKKCKIVSSNVRSVYEQKRSGFYDISGNVVLQTDEGNICVVNNTQFQSIASIQIITQNKIYNIFEEQEKIVTVDNNVGIKVDDISYVFVSQYSHKIIKDIFDNKSTSLLPKIDEGFLSHEVLFSFIESQNLEEVNFT